MITDPIILADRMPWRFKILCGECVLGFLQDCTSVYISDDGHEATNIDCPRTQLIIRHISTKQNKYRFLNTIIFTIPLSYMNKLKGFKINNSSWVDVDILYQYGLYCKGRIVCSTPLDMMAVCNELFDFMIDITIYFPVVKI